MKKKILLVLSICLQNIFSYSQSTPAAAAPKVNTVQPVIMVIPRVNEGEDIRTVLDKDFNKRLGVSKVKEAFDNRNFNTKSFEATLKLAMDNKLFTSDNQTDMKSQIIEMSAADIYVEVDVSPLTQGAGGNNIKVILEGSDCSTGTSYANKICESGNFNVTDVGALISRAIDKNKEEFMNTLQSKFTDISNNGRPVTVIYKLAQNSTWKFDKEIDGTPFSDVIDAWMADNSVNNDYHLQGDNALTMPYEIRIPLKDEKGKNFSPKNFSLKIYNWLKTKNIQSAKESRNGIIYITIK